MLSLVGRVLNTPATALRTVTRARVGDARTVWMRGDHVHVAVRGVPPEKTAEYGQALAARVGALPGVEWAGLDAGAGRLADDLGILTGTVVTGPELDRLGDDELDALLPELAVCARVTPEHKARLVAALQRTGHVVAMTGDGVNDAAAIRRADVGIALGGDSTEPPDVRRTSSWSATTSAASSTP